MSGATTNISFKVGPALISIGADSVENLEKELTALFQSEEKAAALMFQLTEAIEKGDYSQVINQQQQTSGRPSGGSFRGRGGGGGGQSYGGGRSQGQGRRQSAPRPQAGDDPSCRHGIMSYKSGTNRNGKDYAGWFCPADECSPVWDN